MAIVSVRDFIPPIFFRIARVLGKASFKKNQIRLVHPFDAIPLSNGDVRYVLDVGANQGDVAIAALKSYPNAHVICFEPVQSTYGVLRDRLEAYRERVTLYQYALSDESGDGEINLTSFHGANSILPQAQWHKEWNPHVVEQGKERIIKKTLDDVCTLFESKYIDVAKIDVEGHELNVLSGGRNFFRNYVRYIIIEISFMRDASLTDQHIFKIFTLLNELGFALINVIDLYPAPENPSNLMIAQMDCVFMNTNKTQV